MSEELEYVIDLMRKIHDNWDDNLKVLYAEEGVMYTIRIGNETYKGLHTGDKPLNWKIIEVK